MIEAHAMEAKKANGEGVITLPRTARGGVAVTLSKTLKEAKAGAMGLAKKRALGQRRKQVQRS